MKMEYVVTVKYVDGQQQWLKDAHIPYDALVFTVLYNPSAMGKYIFASEKDAVMFSLKWS
jgi:hypothetical protein